MAGPIYVMEEGGDLHALNESAYEAEEVLQELLRDHPDLLAGEQMTSAEPRRWILVDREFGIADDQAVSRRWSLDHLFLDQDGIPTLVEVKRSANREIRRQIVGQMMDYAANAIRYGDVDRIRRLFHKRHDDPDSALQDRLGTSDPEGYWDQVKENLDRGEIRMVFVADQIPSELRRIVEFLNGQMAPAEVLAVEVTQYEGEGLKTLVPRTVGQTAEAEQRKGNQKPQWSKSNFFDEVAERTSQELARRIQGVYNLAVEEGCEVEWRPGDSHGGFFVDAGSYRLFKFEVDGSIWTDTRYFAGFIGDEDWEELRAWTEPLGLGIPESPSERKHPQRSLEDAGDQWWEEFESFFEWIRERAKSNPA